MPEHVCARLELRGRGGEAIDLERTLSSHGVASLPPNRLGPGELSTVIASSPRRAFRLIIRAGGGRTASVLVGGPSPSPVLAAAACAMARRMLRMDDDLTGFYQLAREDPELSWAAQGAGRMLSCASVFEEVVKTICTTNCTWSATERMVGALVRNLGARAPDGGRAFPSPDAMARVNTPFYADVVRSGYRSRHLHHLAREVASGALDLEALRAADLPDEEVERRLLGLPGVGPYAAAHLMLTALGRYHQLVLDSWTLPTWARLSGREPRRAAIEARFEHFGRYRGLAFWLYLTREWVPE